MRISDWSSDVCSSDLWLTQGQMATLFDTSADNISLHLKNIYQEAELSESATTEESSVVRQEGKRNVRRQIKHYNLDAIVSVGYRVSSKREIGRASCRERVCQYV